MANAEGSSNDKITKVELACFIVIRILSFF